MERICVLLCVFGFSGQTVEAVKGSRNLKTQQTYLVREMLTWIWGQTYWQCPFDVLFFVSRGLYIRCLRTSIQVVKSVILQYKLSAPKLAFIHYSMYLPTEIVEYQKNCIQIAGKMLCFTFLPLLLRYSGMWIPLCSETMVT